MAGEGSKVELVLLPQALCTAHALAVLNTVALWPYLGRMLLMVHSEPTLNLGEGKLLKYKISSKTKLRSHASAASCLLHRSCTWLILPVAALNPGQQLWPPRSCALWGANRPHCPRGEEQGPVFCCLVDLRDAVFVGEQCPCDSTSSQNEGNWSPGTAYSEDILGPVD